jgi:protoheme IX farnesyltransferase
MYSFLVLISSILPNIFGFAGNVYLLVSLPLGLIFLTFALTLMIFPKNKLEMHMFGYSIFYLFGIFLAFVLDKFIHGSVL